MKFPCFQYERVRPEYNSIKTFKYEIKKDRNTVNSDEVIEEKFSKLKAKWKQRSRSESS